MIAGLYGAFSIMVAVREIEQKRGAGQIIDLSLFEPILSVLGPIAAIILFQEQYQEGRGAYPKQLHRGTCMSAKTENS